MKVLSENETALLIGDLGKVQLPDGMELYLSFGISQIFQRITSATQENIERDWLYFPLLVLENLIQKKSNVPHDTHLMLNDIQPISCDSFYLFPIEADQSLEVVLVSNKNNLNNLPQETLDCIVKTFETFKEMKQICEKSHDLFLQNVANNNDSIHGFTKSILNLIVKNIPRSCAGLYSEATNCLIRRMVVGDIGKFDLLASIVDGEEKAVWADFNNRKTSFIPTEMLRNEIQFLVNPPDFKFVHRGLLSTYSENYISVIIPGNTDLSLIQFLDTITSMTNKLHESDFIKSTTLIDFYKNYMPHSIPNISSQKLLEKMFLLLNEQLRVTRVRLLQETNSIDVSFSKDNVFMSKEIDALQLESSCLSMLKDSSCVIQETPLKYLQNRVLFESDVEVLSEMVFAFKMHDGVKRYITVAIPKEVAVLNLYASVIQNIVHAFIDCFSAHVLKSEYDLVRQNEKILQTRSELAGKLTKGYFYQISSKMTVLIGKAEQLKEHISKLTDDSEITALLKYLDTIEKNADYVGESVAALKMLIPNEKFCYKRKINAMEMMMKIPQYLGGYIQHLSVGNNLSLRIDNITQGNADFLISGSEVDDVIIPVLLAVLDNATKSGTVSIAAYREVGAEYIKISYHNDLIGQKDCGDILRIPFNDYEIEFDESGNFNFGSMQISTYKNTDNMITISLRLHDTELIDDNADNLIGVTTSV